MKTKRTTKANSQNTNLLFFNTWHLCSGTLINSGKYEAMKTKRTMKANNQNVNLFFFICSNELKIIYMVIKIKRTTKANSQNTCFFFNAWNLRSATLTNSGKYKAIKTKNYECE